MATTEAQLRAAFNKQWQAEVGNVRESFAALSLTADVGLNLDAMTDEEIEASSFNESAVAERVRADLDAVLERYRVQLEQLAAAFGYWRGFLDRLPR
jgi:hypothetical protein